MEPTPTEPTQSRSAASPLAEIVPIENGSALLGYYFAIFSLIPCFGLILGIAAVFLGLKGLKAVKQNPGLPGKVHGYVAVILGGLMGLANLGLLIAFLVALSNRPPQ
jgi:hypothetical protein